MRNDADCTFNGWLRNGGTAPLKIVMEGSATQTFADGSGAFNFSGGVEVRSGTIAFNGRDTYSAQSHGTLTMNGGTFKIIAAGATSSGSFGFTDMQYKGGTIALNINNSAADIINLTAGTIVAVEGMADYVEFNITGNLDLLVDNYTKIVSWTAASAIAENKYRANDYGALTAAFDVRDDGLYVSYVPEPAEWAAIFGALALGLAVYRRRTKRN